MKRVHGDANNKKGRSRLYVIWCHMIERCHTPTSDRYDDYGGRGIKVCDEWRDNYLAFKKWALSNGYNSKLTIDRVDNEGDYTPENCKWSTVKEQCNNRRSNHLLTYKGETKTITQWAETIGMNADTLKYRIYLGWSVEDAIERPVRAR